MLNGKSVFAHILLNNTVTLRSPHNKSAISVSLCKYRLIIHTKSAVNMEPSSLRDHARAYCILIRRLLLGLLPNQMDANVIPERIFSIILHVYLVIHVTMFRGVKSCVLVSTCQCFGGTYCLYKGLNIESTAYPPKFWRTVTRLHGVVSRLLQCGLSRI